MVNSSVDFEVQCFQEFGRTWGALASRLELYKANFICVWVFVCVLQLDLSLLLWAISTVGVKANYCGREVETFRTTGY